VGMDGMVEENGTSGGAGSADPMTGGGATAASSTPHVVAVTSIVQLTLPSQAPSAQVFVLILLTIIILLVYMKLCKLILIENISS
jgi:hypothetical protein